MGMIKLTRGEWSFDETQRLGPPGGFGEVFKGRGPQGDVAVKRLNITAAQAAHRELAIGHALSNRTLRNVVPVLDSGQDAASDRYFLVMPVCQESLQDRLQSVSPLPADESKSIILQIIDGLEEVNDLVHRDLKPGNVLLHEGLWKISDFGIAKFVEDSTSLLTLRDSLTPAFAAPEQWRGERATHATDVYALGCIAYSLLSGQPPFVGSVDEVRRLHLESVPTALSPALGGPRLSAFAGQMLRKAPEARPDLNRCRQVFESIEVKPSSTAHAGLLAAASHVATKAAEAEAAAEAARIKKQQRDQLASDAIEELFRIRDSLFRTICDVSDEARIDGQQLLLGAGAINFSQQQKFLRQYEDKPNRPRSGWDVVAHSIISIKREPKPLSRSVNDPFQRVMIHVNVDNGYTWTSALVFAKTAADVTYRWREVAFWNFNGNRANEPLSLDPSQDEFDIALSNMASSWQVAFGPVAIDAEDEEAFQHRWITMLSRAAVGELSRPNQMPVPSNWFNA